MNDTIRQSMKSKFQIKSVNSWFGVYAHRNSEAALPIMYAMACIEIVVNESEKAKEIYNQIINKNKKAAKFVALQPSLF